MIVTKPTTNPVRPVRGITVPQPKANNQVAEFDGAEAGDQGNVSSATRVAKENQVAVTAYIAGQTNYYIEGVIYSKDAIPKYKELRDAELLKDEADRITETVKLNSDLQVATGKQAGTVQLSKEYSQTKFRSFFTEAYKEVLAKNYAKVISAETKPEYVVVRNLLDKDVVGEHEVVRTNEKLNHEAAAANIKEGIFVIKRKNLVGYMAAVTCKWVAVLDWENNQDPEHPNGKIITSSKVTSAGTQVYDLLYIKRDLETGMSAAVKTLLELNIPYAVSTDKTENKGTLDVSKVINRDTIEKLHGPKFDYKALGKRKDLSAKSGLDENALKQAKADCIVHWGKKGLGKKFEDIGLRDEDVKALRNTKNRPRASAQSVDDLIDQHFTNIHSYKRKNK